MFGFVSAVLSSPALGREQREDALISIPDEAVQVQANALVAQMERN